MWVSAIFGVKLDISPLSVNRSLPRFSVGCGDVSGGGLVIECSSRPQKKATKHHMKTRPRKTRPSDIRRRPTVYPPLPPLPPEWSLVSDECSAADAGAGANDAEPQPVLSE